MKLPREPLLPLGLPKRGRPIAVPRQRRERPEVYQAVKILRENKITVWRISDEAHLVGRLRLSSRQLIDLSRKHEPQERKAENGKGHDEQRQQAAA